MKITSFDIINSSENDMYIIHEPEGFEFILHPKDEITIEVDSTQNSVALRYSHDKDICVIGILDDKSHYKVFHKGINVFKPYL